MKKKSFTLTTIYNYTKITQKGEFVEKENFAWYDDNGNLSMDYDDLFFLNGEQVTKEYWEKKTEKYRNSIVFLEWINWETRK